MDVSNTKCVACAAAYYNEGSVPRRLRTETCNSNWRVYAAVVEVSMYIK
jgi:hypothetical protein